jgi:hypothetical protein
MAVPQITDPIQVAMARLHVGIQAGAGLLNRISRQIDREHDAEGGWDIRLEPGDINRLLRIVGAVGAAGDALHGLLLMRDPDPDAPRSRLYSLAAIADRIVELRAVAGGERLLSHDELLTMARRTALQMEWLASLSGLPAPPPSAPE